MEDKIKSSSKLLNEIKALKTKVQKLEQQISKHKKTQRESLATKQLFEKITATSPAIITVYDLKSKKTIYENRSLLESHGYSQNEVKRINGLSDEERAKLCHPGDVIAVRNFYQKIPVMKDGQRYELEYRLKDNKGQWKWIRKITSVFKRDKKGLPVQLVSIYENINTKKIAESALKRWNEELERRVNERTKEYQDALIDFRLTKEELKEARKSAETVLRNFRENTG